MNRRHLAGASAAALLVGLAGPGKAAELDGELLARVDALVAFLARKRATRAAMSEPERLDAEAAEHRNAFTGLPAPEDVLAAAIARIPARTPEGGRAKARAMVWLHRGNDTAQAGWALGNGLFESMLMDLTGATCVLRPFPAGRVAVPAAVEQDARLLELCHCFHALNHEAQTLPSEGDGTRTFSHALDERWAVSAELQDARPRTMAGRIAKAGVALALYEELNGDTDLDDFEAFIMATLRHVAGQTSQVTA